MDDAPRAARVPRLDEAAVLVALEEDEPELPPGDVRPLAEVDLGPRDLGLRIPVAAAVVRDIERSAGFPDDPEVLAVPAGGIGRYGYPVGIAGGNGKDFGIIGESRGTLYVSRDGGHRWHALPRISRPEVDFGVWASTLGDAGYVLLERNQRTRLITTTDAGRTWRVVHRWR